MLQLERMVELSLQQARLFDGAISLGGMDARDPDARDEAQPARPTGNLQLILAKGASLHVVDLGVTRYMGLLFRKDLNRTRVSADAIASARFPSQRPNG
ncbi:MAG: hypothetical protein ABIO17_06255 [Pseudoxanthomonas sp.]